MLNKTTSTTTRGFTLVELMLAMAFFSSILALSSVTFVQVLTIYNKGLAVKQMNQAGRTLTDGLIRNANQGFSDMVLAPAAGQNTVRCIQLGETTYLLSYNFEEPIPPASAPTTAYRFSDNLRPVNFVRYNQPKVDCPPTTTTIARSDVSPVVDGALRVYYTDITHIPDEKRLLRFKLVLGTYTAGGPTQDPSLSGSSVTCPLTSFGDFCATSSYETVLYLSNRQGGA